MIGGKMTGRGYRLAGEAMGGWDGGAVAGARTRAGGGLGSAAGEGRSCGVWRLPAATGLVSRFTVHVSGGEDARMAMIANGGWTGRACGLGRWRVGAGGDVADAHSGTSKRRPTDPWRL